jgi:tRNA-specific 2-thiouridylase
VSQDWHDPLLMNNKLTAKHIQWQAHILDVNFRAKARIRHLQELQDCTVFQSQDSQVLTLHFDKEQRAITPGQSVVLYQNELCIAGGIID